MRVKSCVLMNGDEINLASETGEKYLKKNINKEEKALDPNS